MEIFGNMTEEKRDENILFGDKVRGLSSKSLETIDKKTTEILEICGCSKDEDIRNKVDNIMRFFCRRYGGTIE